MFLDITAERNPELMEVALYYHQKGLLSPNTYVIDADAVRENAAILADEAKRQKIQLYFMTKQLGRNPLLARTITEAGIKKAVAVDPWEAERLAASGILVGHIGHLVQIPQSMIEGALEMHPDVITVFSYEKAKFISDTAVRIGKTQDILLRVVDEEDFLYPGQQGGILLEQLAEQVKKIAQLPGVSIRGVTSFPCLMVEDGKVKPTPNVRTLQKAVHFLNEQGYDRLEMNVPSVSTATTLHLIKQLGGTQAEPGHALTGTTPLHAKGGQPEKPAMVYVSEVSHVFKGHAYVYGGGFYPRSHIEHALVGKTFPEMTKTEVIPNQPGTIDYYGTLQTDQATVGDTALFAFRTQIFVTNAYVAVVEGIGNNPKLSGVFDSRGEQLR